MFSLNFVNPSDNNSSSLIIKAELSSKMFSLLRISLAPTLLETNTGIPSNVASNATKPNGSCQRLGTISKSIFLYAFNISFSD